MKRFLVLTTLLLVAATIPQANAQTAVVYDGLKTGTVPTFTGSLPRTYLGQGFTVADPGTSMVAITSMRIVMVVGAAVDYADSQLRIQFWDTYNSAATGATLVFSNPLPLQTFNTGPLSVAGPTAFTFTLNFATPIMLSGLSNHGISVNWQSDPTGSGTFADDTLLTTALRTGAAGPPPALMAGAANNNPGGGYYRNASGLTTFNFQANDSRNITNVGGLMFELTAVAVPEPSTVAMLGIAGVVAGGAMIRRRRSKS